MGVWGGNDSFISAILRPVAVYGYSESAELLEEKRFFFFSFSWFLFNLALRRL